MRRWPLLRNRDYMLLWSGETLSEFGSQTSTIAYPLLVLALTGSAAKAGLVGMARWLPLAIFAAVGGMLAISGAGGLLGAALAAPLRRRLTGRGVIAGGECMFAAAVLLLLLHHNVVLIGLLVAVAELPAPVTNSLVAGSRAAAAPDHMQGRVAAVSVLISMSLGWLGPPAVGFVFEQTGPTVTTLVLAGWVVGIAIAALLAPGLRHDPHGRGPSRSDPSVGTARAQPPESAVHSA